MMTILPPSVAVMLAAWLLQPTMVTPAPRYEGPVPMPEASPIRVMASPLVAAEVRLMPLM